MLPFLRNASAFLTSPWLDRIVSSSRLEMEAEPRAELGCSSVQSACLACKTSWVQLAMLKNKLANMLREPPGDCNAVHISSFPEQRFELGLCVGLTEEPLWAGEN